MKILSAEYQPAPYYVKKHEYIGTINIPDGNVDITDPCYKNGTWCAMFNHKIKPGIYKCYITTVNFRTLYNVNDYEIKSKPYLKHYRNNIYALDDERIMILEIVHSGENQEYKYTPLFQNIGVDSGLCGFYNHKSDFTNDNDWENFWQNLSELKNGCVCDCKDNRVTVSPGFGDGCYILSEAKNKNNETIALKLFFDDEQYLEESYADEEE